MREIAARIGITQETVIADLRAEEDRRRDENANRREQDAARAIGFYERVIARAMDRADLADAIMAQIAKESDDKEDKREKHRGKSVSDRSLDTALKAREHIDKLLGLDAPTKTEPEVKIIIEGGLPEFPR